MFENFTFQEMLRLQEVDEDVIGVKRIYIDIADDLIAGIVLSQIVFWHQPNKVTGDTKLRVNKQGYFWIAKTRKDWWKECRVTDRQFDRAIGILEKRGLVVKKTFKFNGSPTVHVRLLQDNMMVYMRKLLQKGGQRNIEMTENVITGNYGKCNIEMTESVISLTEITTENTTESTKKNINIPPHEPAANKKAASDKIRYADFVTLTEAEHQKLVDKHGQAVTDQLIAKLNDYKGAHGKRYKSDYYAIHSWVLKAYLEEQERKPKEKGYKATEIV